MSKNDGQVIGSQISADSSLQPSEINFGELFKKAMDFEPTDEQTQAVGKPAVSSDGHPQIPSPSEVTQKIEQTSEPVAAKLSDDEKSLETTDEVVDSKVLELSDETLVRAKIDGKDEVVSYKEFKDSLQRQAAYTKRMQTFAKQRQDAEEQLANQYVQLQQYANKIAYAQQQMEQNNPIAKLSQMLEEKSKVEQDPNTIATIGEIQKALAEHRQQIANEFQAREYQQQQRLAYAAQQLKQDQVVSIDAQKFTNAMYGKDLENDFKVVQTVVPSPELADAIVRWNVSQMGPQSIDEGIQMMKEFISGWAANVRKHQQVNAQEKSAQKARAVIEGPKGSPPSPQKVQPSKSFFNVKENKLDWNALRERAESMLG